MPWSSWSEIGCDEGNAMKPRVIEVDEQDEDIATHRIEPAPPVVPKVIETERAERVAPVQPARFPAIKEQPAAKRRSFSVGLAGLGLCFAGWLVVDAYWWVAAAFERSTTLGALAATALTAGIVGAGAIAAREIKSLWRLRDVESVRARFDQEIILPRDARATIAGILAVVPKDPEIEPALAAFRRQVQAHHTVAQQVEILSRTVMRPLDRRAEAHVRTAVLRAFGITAISPTALSDAAFFLACGLRMVRGVAAAYGHRPTATATVHLLRRILFEAAKLATLDVASTTLIETLGGAAAERLATNAADSLYASYRMARLGIIVMDLCRPIPFCDDDVPRLTSLVARVVRRKPEDER
jgi:putative membrane protein